MGRRMDVVRDNDRAVAFRAWRCCRCCLCCCCRRRQRRRRRDEHGQRSGGWNRHVELTRLDGDPRMISSSSLIVAAVVVGVIVIVVVAVKRGLVQLQNESHAVTDADGGTVAPRIMLLLVLLLLLILLMLSLRTKMARHEGGRSLVEGPPSEGNVRYEEEYPTQVPHHSP
jgi:hypothetical protein